VTGPFNSGKTQFIKTVSDIPVVSTEKRITTEDRGFKAETTVAMDYGRTLLDDDLLYLYGTPGQARFEFMWDILSSEIDGFVMLVDSTDTAFFPDAVEMIAYFSERTRVPYLVAANKTDLSNAVKFTELRRRARLDEDVVIVPCVATQRSSVRQVLLQLVRLLREANPTP
jgi:signal recognition particle receptor subunit beta